jgi:hypothetical protein
MTTPPKKVKCENCDTEVVETLIGEIEDGKKWCEDCRKLGGIALG